MELFRYLQYKPRVSSSPAQLFAKFCLIDATGVFPLALIVILEHFFNFQFQAIFSGLREIILTQVQWGYVILFFVQKFLEF